MKRRAHKRETGWHRGESLEQRLARTLAFPPAEKIDVDSDAAMSALMFSLEPGGSEDIQLDLKANQRVSINLTVKRAINSTENRLISAKLFDANARQVSDLSLDLDGDAAILDEDVVTTEGTYTLRVESHAARHLRLQAVAYLDVDWIRASSDTVLREHLKFTEDEGLDASQAFHVVEHGLANDTSTYTLSQSSSIGLFRNSVSSESTGTFRFEPNGIDGGSLALEVDGEDPAGPVRQPVPLLFLYDSVTGDLTVESRGAPMTALEIVSPDGLFIGPQPSIVGDNPFNVYFDKKLFVVGMNESFKQKPTSRYEFGPVLAPGLSVETLQSAFRMMSAFLGSGGTPEYAVRDVHQPSVPTLEKQVTRVSTFLDIGVVDPMYGAAKLEFDMRLEELGLEKVADEFTRVSVRFSYDGGDHWDTFQSYQSCPRDTVCRVSQSVHAAEDAIAEIILEGTSTRLLLDNLSVTYGRNEEAMREVELVVSLDDGEYLDLQVSSLMNERECDWCGSYFELVGPAGKTISNWRRGGIQFRDKTTNGQPDEYTIHLYGGDVQTIKARRSFTPPESEQTASLVSIQRIGDSLVAWWQDVDYTTCTTPPESDVVEWDIRMPMTDGSIVYSPIESPPTEFVDVSIPAFACLDLLGNPSVEYSMTVDYIPPEILSERVPNSYRFTSNTAVLEIAFNEEISSASISSEWQLLTPSGESVPWQTLGESFVTPSTLLIVLQGLETGTYRFNPLDLMVGDLFENYATITLPEWTVEIVAPTLSVEQRKYDVNHDDHVNLDDWELLRKLINASGFNLQSLVAFDLNQDDRLDVHDEAILLEDALGFRKGDVNLDGLFDEQDLDQIAQSYGYVGGGWEHGDVNEDGFVDSADLIAAFQLGGYTGDGLPDALGNGSPVDPSVIGNS